MARDDQDPIQWATADDRDLQEIATWEPRTTLDRLASGVYGALLAGGRAAVIGIALAIIAGQIGITALLTLENPLLGVYIGMSVVPAFALALFVWRMDIIRYEPIATLSVTFLLGVVFAGFAAVFNTALRGLFVGLGGFGLIVYFFFIVGPIEETVKLFAVRIHAYRTETFDSVIDGAIYGAVAGLGFAAIENMMYITEQFLQTASVAGSGFLVPTAQTAALRSFAGPGHVIYSAFAGYYLGLAKFNPEHRGPLVIKGLLVAAAIHATYNSLVSNLHVVSEFVPYLQGLPPEIAFVVFVVVFDGFLLALLYVKLERYRRTFEEVDADRFYKLEE